ncbi:M48 family metallopeptidase [Thiorhodococcus mannitoliphagus]|uniref:M48 family metallopeptidase n=1 Tax=Thiorhodococcus mannitoliphagus TaxID=329406 RepID=A0A6P1DKP8_9GAMM|nr:SprT family zinc-dependent metalloprotease [Thiorhodococcus mannitoliphagus]NEX18797.1 M48 family metallopeptidase [Thiorhodococcus mannitoliphagus]
MSLTLERLAVDELTFEVRRSAQRKTLEITLDRGGELIIAAPPGIGQEVLAAFVREKRFWLYAKMAEKESRLQPLEAKEFVSGAGFPYLGRSYRLLLVDAQEVPLKLEAGRFKLRRSLASEGRRYFVHWYSSHARTWLRTRVRGWARRMALQPDGIEVRDLGFRWGSCGRGGKLNFHWAVMLMPVGIVDYVIVHELAHLEEPNHTPAFWQRVSRAMPDYGQRKAWLAEHGGRHVSL